MTKPRHNGILRPDWRDLRKVLFSGMTAVRRNSIMMRWSTAYPTTAVIERSMIC